MTRLSTLLTRATAAIMLGSTLLLAGCHVGGTKDDTATAPQATHFDTVVKAYKDGQFLVDGALLSAVDTSGHFSYLKDQGRLPKTVLLERSDESKIRTKHLQYMARMQLDFGFIVYYDEDGTLTRINPVDAKTRALEDSGSPIKLGDPLQGSDAAAGGYDPNNDERRRGY